MNEEYLESLENKAIEQVDIRNALAPELGAEMDEMWSFYHDKGHQIWLWWAVDHATGVPLAYHFGTREHANLDALLALLKPFKIKKVYADGNYAYQERIPFEDLIITKKNTQNIERKHLTLRTRVKRLCRKTICFSKLERMHKIVVGLFINTFFFGRKICLV